MLEKADYRMVMLDIDMPGTSGMQILKSIRDLGQPVFAVMVSSHTTMENVKSAIEMGANGFVVKPYKETKIGDILSKYRAWADESAAASADTI